jgi:hypothetical protein
VVIERVGYEGICGGISHLLLIERYGNQIAGTTRGHEIRSKQRGRVVGRYGSTGRSRERQLEVDSVRPFHPICLILGVRHLE